MENHKLPGAAAACAMMLCILLSVWLGISGPIVSDVNAIGMMAVIEKWQTLIGVAGAFLIAWVAVQPVWRQVRIMGAQAAVQLQPLLLAEISALDRDAIFLQKLVTVDKTLAILSNQIDIWKGSSPDLVARVADILISVRTEIKRMSHEEWSAYCDRLGLDQTQRSDRSHLQELLARISDQSMNLTKRQQGPVGEDRASFLNRVAERFILDIADFVDDSRAKLKEALITHQIKLAVERRSLHQRGEQIQRSIESVG